MFGQSQGVASELTGLTLDFRGISPAFLKSFRI